MRAGGTDSSVRVTVDMNAWRVRACLNYVLMRIVLEHAENPIVFGGGGG